MKKETEREKEAQKGMKKETERKKETQKGMKKETEREKETQKGMKKETEREKEAQKEMKKETGRKKYDAVVFDLDGTLLDTLDDLTASANAAVAYCGMPQHTRQEVKGFVGNGIRLLIERMLPGESREEWFETAFEKFKEHYAAHCMDETEPYPGVISLLDWLKKEGYRTAIVSNKADFAVKKLKEVYFRDLIDIAVGEKEGIRKKPEPDMVYHALACLHVPAGRALYVGDSEVDIRTAQNAGMDAAIVTWGFREKEFLREQGAGLLVDSIAELRKFIQD